MTQQALYRAYIGLCGEEMTVKAVPQGVYPNTVKIVTPTMQETKIRLAEIDTPERGQPFGTWGRYPPTLTSMWSLQTSASIRHRSIQPR